jgi:large subunit ribosomal protein L25
MFLKFYHATGHSTLFELLWEDGKESVFIREVQLDPVRREPVHVDFFAPNLRRPVRASVPVVLHNPVQMSGAVLTETRTEVEVEALPARIPHQLDVNVSGLQNPGDVIRVGDLTLPDGVTVVTDPNEIVAQIEAVYVEPAAAEEAVEAPVAEAAAEETGTAGEGEGAAE